MTSETRQLPALSREYIPTNGVVSDLLQGQRFINLSVAVGWNVNRLEQMRDSNKEHLLNRLALWQEQKMAKAGMEGKPQGTLLAIGRDTEDLMTFAVSSVVASKLFMRKGPVGRLMTDVTSYPLLGWNVGINQTFELPFINNLIAQSLPEPHLAWPGKSLREYIKNAQQLPEDVKVVYVDNPPTRGELVTASQIASFAKANPDVLIIIDQGNIGFSLTQQESEAYDVSVNKQLFVSDHEEEPLVLILETATKASGMRGLATATAVTEKTIQLFREDYLLRQDSIVSPKLPICKMTDGELLQANQTATQLISPESAHIRATIAEHRQILAALLQSQFEGSLPFGEGLNPHIIVSAKALGYKTGQDMVDRFAKQRPRFAIKTCIYYAQDEADPKAKDEVFVAIPYDKRQFDSLVKRLAKARR